MHRWIAIAAVATVALSTSGCVMAVRKVAREANRSSVEAKGKERFPIGSSVAAARTALTTDGYRCRDMPELGKTKEHVSCWASKRTSAPEKFLVGGNWRYDIYGDGDRLTRVHIASARHGMKAYRKAAKERSALTDPLPM